jgi:hypothetical protein
MPLGEFIEGGFLHEVNRLLLHPLGVALAIDASTGQVRVWDERDDPEGTLFGEDLLSADKAEHIADQMFTRRAARKEKLGYVIQPVETDKPTLTTTYIDPAERTKG